MSSQFRVNDNVVRRAEEQRVQEKIARNEFREAAACETVERVQKHCDSLNEIVADLR